MPAGLFLSDTVVAPKLATFVTGMIGGCSSCRTAFVNTIPAVYNSFVPSCGRRVPCSRALSRPRRVVTCSVPSFDENETGRPPNFFGAHDPAELEQIWSIHQEFVGERPPKQDGQLGGGTEERDALDSIVGGGLHEAVLEALKPVNDASD